MPTLDQRGIPVTGSDGLKINYSSLYPLNGNELRKLSQSFNLGRVVIKCACSRVEELLRYETFKVALADDLKAVHDGNINDAVYQSFTYHFKFEELAYDKAGQFYHAAPAWHQWRADLTAILDKMRQIQLGLLGNVTISDTRGEGIMKALRIEIKDGYSGSKMKSLITQYTGGPGPRNDKDLAYYVSQAMQIEQLSNGLRRAADEYQPADRGSVPVSRAAWDRMSKEDQDKFNANDPTLTLPTDSRKNIHLDFRLLGDASEPALRIATDIVHEASHRYADMRDCAYADEAFYKTMSKFDAMHNADSFALAATCLYKNRFFEDDDAMLESGKHGVDLNA